MALVTVQRSPTPSNSPELFDEQHSSVSELCQCSSGTATPCSQKTCRTTLRQRSLSECYFAVKGAAVILPQNECLTMPRQSNSAGGDIQLHLHAMLHLLRPQDTLKMAVRLESLLGKHTRYMAIVSTNGRQDTQESIILGIDYVGPQEITIGLVLPIWASTRIALDGDGGICVESNGSHHVFKPVSVQAMWSVFQSLHKEHNIATRYPYYPGGLSHTWTQYYEARISSPEAFRSEWHYTYQDDSDLKADSLDRFKEKPPERAAAEKLIRMTLKDIMQSVDLDEVTSKDIRTKLEDKLEMNLIEYKEFIDEEMLVILGQMDKPSQIFPYLYLGSEWNASNFDELKQNNVGHILNVTKEVDNFFPGLFFYMKVSVSDEESTELLKYWDSTFRFIFKAREKNSAVLVHCKKGISRSSSTVIAYAMKAYGLSVEEALKHVKEKRNCITPNKGFMEQLRTYQGILDASRNRNSALFNQLKLTPSEPELVPWDGLGDDEELKKPGVDPLGVVYSKKLENAVAVAVPGLLVASENILKSGPSSEYAFPTSSCEYVGKEECQQTVVGSMQPPPSNGQETMTSSPMMVHRWISPPVTGVVGSLTSKFEGVCRSGTYAGELVNQTDLGSENKDLDILEFEATMSWREMKEEKLPEVSSRPPLRRQLQNVEERIRDQQLTLRSVQEILMRRGSHSPTTSDSCSLSSGDESDPCNGGATTGANVKQRRNSKSSSGDSAIADLTRFPSGADWPNEIQTATANGAGERPPLAQSCPADSFGFMNVTPMGAGEADETSFRRPISYGMESTIGIGVGAPVEQPVVPPGQVRRVTMQYERGLRTTNNRRSSPALMSLEKEDSGLEMKMSKQKPIPVVMESPRRSGHPPRCDDSDKQKTTRINSAPTPVAPKKMGAGKRIFGRLFSSSKKEQMTPESAYSETKYGTSLLKSGQTTWYDELRKRAATTTASTPTTNTSTTTTKNRPKSDGYKIWASTTRGQHQRETYDSSTSLTTSPTKVSLKVSEPGKVRTRKEKFEGRNGMCFGTTTNAYTSSGIGAASIWMATSHEGSVKRITTDLESRCQSSSMTPLVQRASFDGGRPIEEQSKIVKSIVGHFEPSKQGTLRAVGVAKSNSGGHQQHGTYPIGSAHRKRAPTSWMRHGSWFDLPSCGGGGGDNGAPVFDEPSASGGAGDVLLDDESGSPLRRAGSYSVYRKRVPESPEGTRSRSLTRHFVPPGTRRCASTVKNEAHPGGRNFL